MLMPIDGERSNETVKSEQELEKGWGMRDVGYFWPFVDQKSHY